MPQHLIDRITMIGMLLAATEHCVYHITVPIQLQGLEPFYLFVRGFNTMTYFGVIVVEDRRIEAKHNNRKLNQFQSPDEQILQQLPEQVDP